MIMAASLGGVAFGGSVTAILLNTPGDAPNACTILDGYPMAKQGRAGEAIAASAVSSALGAIIGLCLLVVLVPFIRPVLFMFHSPEFFWLAMMGLVMIAMATRGSVLSDLIAAGFGLMLAFHGFNPVTGSPRFTWDVTYLLDGITLVPLIIGLFAVAEMVHLMGKQSSIAEASISEGGRVRGIKAVLDNPGTLFRASIIGWFIGIIPGVGGTLANFVAYFQEKGTAKDSDSFGQGNVRGVIASEASNDAKDGGSMIPTLALGIPGSASTAVLLGAFIAFGVTPGPILFRENLHIVFIVVFALLISNVLTSSMGLFTANYLTKVTKLPIGVLAPTVLVIAFVGAFAIRNSFPDVLMAFLFGLVGYVFIRYDISRITLTIAFILGTLIENNFHQSLQAGQGDIGALFVNPISKLLILLTVVFLLLPLYKSIRRESGTA